MATEPTLEELQAEWDAWPDDGSRCAVGDKPPRPTAEDDVPEGMTRDQLYGTPAPPDPVVEE